MLRVQALLTVLQLLVALMWGYF